MAILKLRDKDGNVYEVPALKGEGDMSASVYDPQGKATDIFNYVDEKIADIPTPDVSTQIAEHNAALNAHADILNGYATTTYVDNAIGAAIGGSY